MFFLRPNVIWKNQGTKLLAASGTGQRGPFSLFSSLGRRSAPAQRRAVDALGLRPATPALPGKPFFVSTAQTAARGGQLVLDYTSTDSLSPGESRQLLELQDGADDMMSELTQAEQALAAFGSQPGGRSVTTNELSLTAQQTFLRTEERMHRWSLRAEQIERANGSLFALASASVVPAYRHRTTLTVQQQPLPATRQPHSQGRTYSALRPRQTLGQIKQRRLLLADKNAQARDSKLGTLRQQMNMLAMRPAQFSIARRARFASLHARIDHMAQELNEHRHAVEGNMHKNVNRRRNQRLPQVPATSAPVLRPKVKGETT